MSKSLTPKERRFVENGEAEAEKHPGLPGYSSLIREFCAIIRRLERKLDGPKRDPKRARARGQEWQQEVASILRAIWPEAHSNQQPRGAKRDGCDVEKTPLWVECKNDRGCSLQTAYRQAVRERSEAGDNRPIVVAAQTPQGRLAVVTLAQLVKWLDGLEAADELLGGA